MSLIWMSIIGLIAGGITRLLMPGHSTSGLFILGMAGSIIAGLMQYSLHQPVGFIVPCAGAGIVLVTYAAIARSPVAQKADRDDFRKAA